MADWMQMPLWGIAGSGGGTMPASGQSPLDWTQFLAAAQMWGQQQQATPAQMSANWWDQPYQGQVGANGLLYSFPAQPRVVRTNAGRRAAIITPQDYAWGGDSGGQEGEADSPDSGGEQAGGVDSGGGYA